MKRPSSLLSRTVLGSSLAAVSLATPFAFSQTSTTGAIRGIVTDAQGAVVAGAVVTATSKATAQSHQTKSDSAGQFTIGLLPPELYTLTITAPGFKTTEAPPITVTVTETARADAKLTVGSQSETVEVTAGTAQLQVENATLGTVVQGQTIREVPLTNRNFTQVLTMSAGVSGDVNNAAALGKGTQDVYVNGASSISNNFHMDGADINNFGSGRAGDFVQQAGIAIPNPDTLQEFKIQTTNYDAGFGRDAGANVDVVTKTGSNAIHGSVWEFFRNDVLNANDTFLKIGGQKRAVMKQNQFGGTLGGPIRKDKIFFFGSYQGTRQINGLSSSSLASNVLFPLTNDRSAAAIGAIACPSGSTATTPDGRAKWAPFNGGVNVACDGSNINPVALNLLRQKIANGSYYIPTPQTYSSDTNGNPVGKSTFSIPSRYSEDQFLINTDYLLNAKHTLSQRYFYSRQPQNQPFSSTSNTPGNGVTPNFNSQVAVLKLTSALSSRFLNEGLIGYIRSVGRLQTQANLTFDQIGMAAPSDPTYPLMPIISTTGYFSLGGVNNDVSFSAVNTFEISDQISFNRGRQSFRAGFTGEKNQFNFDDPNNKRGSVGFQTFQDFLLGQSAAQNGSSSGFSNVNSSSSQQGSYYKGYRGTSMAMFLQDDIKLSSKLTVNTGLRWELNSGVSANHGQLSSFYPSLVTPFQPLPVGGTLNGFVVPNNYRLPVPAGVTRLGSTSLSNNDIPLHNFGPRVGFAYQMVQNTVFRGGYGLFYTLPNGNSVLQTLGGQPFVSSASLSGNANAAATFQTPFTTQLTPGVWRPRSTAYTLTVTGVADNIDSPLVQQYNLEAQQQLPGKMVLEVGYVGTRGTRLAESRALNRSFLASPSNPINGVTTNTLASANIQARVPYQGFTPGGVTRIETYGFSNYNSLQTVLRKQMSHGLYLQAAYTWSKGLTSVTGGDGTNGVFAGGSGNSNDPNDRSQRWGPAGFDRTNRLVVVYTYQLPSWKNGGAFVRTATGGWKISGVSTFQSGKPLTFTDTRNGTAFGTASRAQFAAGFTNKDIKNANGGSMLDRIRNNTYFNSGNTVFTAAPYAPNSTTVTPGATVTPTSVPTLYGNSAIGAVRGPGNQNWDMTLIKTTKVGGLGEDATLDFRTEFFNVWNHAQYANPGTGVGTASYGLINASSVAPRLIQFALKYQF